MIQEQDLVNTLHQLHVKLRVVLHLHGIVVQLDVMTLEQAWELTHL